MSMLLPILISMLTGYYLVVIVIRTIVVYDGMNYMYPYETFKKDLIPFYLIFRQLAKLREPLKEAFKPDKED